MGRDNYNIRFTPLAYEDLDEIDTYISETLMNPQAAECLLEEMEQSKMRIIRQLKCHPLIFRKYNPSIPALQSAFPLAILQSRFWHVRRWV